MTKPRLTLITRAGIDKAIAEFNKLGRDEFLTKYGYNRSKRFFVKVGRKRYDSKAIIGVAHKHDADRVLGAHEFSGGQSRLGGILRRVGLDLFDSEAA